MKIGENITDMNGFDFSTLVDIISKFRHSYVRNVVQSIGYLLFLSVKIFKKKKIKNKIKIWISTQSCKDHSYSSYWRVVVWNLYRWQMRHHYDYSFHFFFFSSFSHVNSISILISFFFLKFLNLFSVILDLKIYLIGKTDLKE